LTPLHPPSLRPWSNQTCFIVKKKKKSRIFSVH